MLLKIAVRAAEASGATVTAIDLADFPMPIYDGDIESEHGLPENARKLKALFMAHNGLLIAAQDRRFKRFHIQPIAYAVKSIDQRFVNFRIKTVG